MKLKHIFIIGSLFLSGFGLGLITSNILSTSKESSLTARQVRQGGYALINPLLECELGQKVLSARFVSFRYAVDEEVKKLKESKTIENMAVYFRDLNNGLFFGINQNEGFSPASLLKLPIMIAYYKEAEIHPEILKKKLTFTDTLDRNLQENIRPEKPIEKGKEYSIADLIYSMMVYSDNNAMALLVENMPLVTQDKVYKDLGITIPGVRGTEDFMSVSEYASFFRILYNSSYLAQDSSEKALDLLSKVDFSEGLRAGVPRNILVANKFGERAINNKKQLHDCGIIYFNDHPYLLCIMSRGTDFAQLAESISRVSRVVYKQVENQVRTLE